MVAHRGAQQILPENTISAFRLAIKKGFRIVECDVQLTKDGQLVVIHDETVDRTTDGHGWVSKFTKIELEQLTISGGEHVPSLEEVYDEVVIKSKRKLIIEIKADTDVHSKKVATALADYINKTPASQHKRLEVHSFWYEALFVFNELCQDVETAAIINGGFSAKQIVEIAHDTNSNGVSLGYEFLSPKIIRMCHRSGLFVDTWAVSDGTVLKRLRPFGLKAVVENFTGILIKQ